MKENLLAELNILLDTVDLSTKRAVITTVSEFLEQNVVTPMGDNPHEYAKEIHALAEGVEVQKLDNTMMLMTMPPQQKWDTFKFPDGVYRIKPANIIYEWQYLILKGLNGENHLTSFYTDEEFKNAKFMSKCIKLEDTKQIRSDNPIYNNTPS